MTFMYWARYTCEGGDPVTCFFDDTFGRWVCTRCQAFLPTDPWTDTRHVLVNGPEPVYRDPQEDP